MPGNKPWSLNVYCGFPHGFFLPLLLFYRENCWATALLRWQPWVLLLTPLYLSKWPKKSTSISGFVVWWQASAAPVIWACTSGGWRIGHSGLCTSLPMPGEKNLRLSMGINKGSIFNAVQGQESEHLKTIWYSHLQCLVFYQHFSKLLKIRN